MLSGLINNDKALWIPVAACLAVLSFIIGGALLIHEVADVPFPFLTRDPAATFAAPPYLGLLSNATVLIWTAAATVCLFCAALTGAEQPIHKFLLFSGLLTTILLLDDLYMIHEVVAPAYLGLPEKGVYLIYAMVATSWLVKFRDVIVTTEFGLLILSFFFLGLSIGIDILDSRGWFPIADPYLLEDGAKIAGVIFWFAYFFRTAKLAVDEKSRGT